MKQTGLQNRFKDAVRQKWQSWHSCLECWENGADALHHIISPDSSIYVDGEHNRSVLNSCPIHNQKCHVGRDGYLNKEKTIRKLLYRSYNTLTSYLNYELNQRDKTFRDIYGDYYK